QCNYRISLDKHGAVDLVEQYEMSSARRSLQGDSKSARVTFADRFGNQVILLGEAQMNHPSLAWLHGAEHKRGRGVTDLAGRMLGHGAQLSLSGGAIIIRIADYALTFGQRAAERLIKDLLQGVQ